MLARVPYINQIYWQNAASYYRWKISRQINHGAPLDPLKIVWVDPDQISRFSGRDNVIYDRWKDIGTVQQGVWDQQVPSGSTDPKKEHMKGVMTAKTIEETDLYQSFQRHFEEGVEWTDTALYDALLSTVNEGVTIWRGSQSGEDILERCREIDKLYTIIKQSGYKPQLKLLEEGRIDPNHVGLLDVLTDEITLDIGRNGELLFVDGRHRICLAKILDLEAVPVVILVRHTKWLEQREKIYVNQLHPDLTEHPDLAEADGNTTSWMEL